MKSLNELKKEIADNFKEYEKTGTNPWTAKIATMDLSRQVGSLAELIMQKENDRYLKLSNEELKEKISDELADIIADTSFIAHELDFFQFDGHLHFFGYLDSHHSAHGDVVCSNVNNSLMNTQLPSFVRFSPTTGRALASRNNKFFGGKGNDT